MCDNNTPRGIGSCSSRSAGPAGPGQGRAVDASMPASRKPSPGAALDGYARGVLHGRAREQAHIARLLDTVRAGTGGSLVVLGDPGTGKSALLTDVIATASDMTVMRTQGIESEAPLAFAALQRLLRPLMSRAADLPAPQAHALRVALGEELGEASDRFLVFLGTLSLLADAAESRPVLAVVDDAHWLDDVSATALLFVARRLPVERVAILFAARESDVRSFEHEGLPALRLGGLGLAEGTDLLREHTSSQVSREVAAQLVASTGGNPLALVEVPRALSAEQLAGGAPLPGRLPITGTIERVFLDRTQRLSAPCQRLLLVAAADDSTRVGTVLAAAATLGAGAEALAEAEASGLVRVEDSHLLMRHPLVRSAIYSAATSLDRRHAHAALASVMTVDDDADRRAWHRAASVEAPDEDVVAELHAAAVRAEQRGGYEASSAAWERAAELSSDAGDRARRLYGAARSAWLAGQPARAKTLADAARSAAQESGLRADVIRLRARIEWNTGSVQLGHRMLLEAARDVAPGDGDRAREMAMFAAAIAAFGGDSGVDVDPIVFAPVPPDAPARQRCFSELLTGLCHVLDDNWPAAHEMLRRSFVTAEQLDLDDQDLLPNLGVAALHLGDMVTADALHQRLLTRARATGAVVMVLYSLTRLAFSDIAAGRWAVASGRQSEALRLGEGTGQPVLGATPRSFMLLLAAFRGEESYDDQLAAVEGAQDGQSLGTLDFVLRDLTRWARGVRAGVRSAAGFHHLAQISHPIIQRFAGIDRIESAAHSGQVEAAQLWVNDLEDFGVAVQQPWATAAAAHGRALLASTRGSTEADDVFDEALALHGQGGRPFDRARTELAYGEHLRRNRHRVAAREHLRSALDTFEDLKAAPWADRAAQELRASGETARKRDTTEAPELTPTELQVARLVQRGMSNREVAAELFVSRRTVDFHLRNVFAKTGVTSRNALTQLTLT